MMIKVREENLPNNPLFYYLLVGVHCTPTIG